MAKRSDRFSKLDERFHFVATSLIHQAIKAHLVGDKNSETVWSSHETLSVQKIRELEPWALIGNPDAYDAISSLEFD